MKKRRTIIACVVAALMSASASAQDMSLSTNILGYTWLGTINAELAYGFARHWSTSVGVNYNPFSFPGRTGIADKMQAKQRSLSVGFRYWPWHIHSGWWLSMKARAQEYNIGGIIRAETSEGLRYGMGLSGGYTYMLNSSFNLEFGAGVWAGKDYYTRYLCPECGRIVGSGEEYFVLPSDVVLGLVYVF